MNLVSCLFFCICILKSKSGTNFSEITGAFLGDFFKEQENIGYNLYGCLSQKERYGLLKTQIDGALLRRINFIQTINILKILKINWLVSDAVSCNIVSYLKEIDENYMFASPFKHLIMISHKDYDDYMKYVKEFQILPMSEVILAIFGLKILTLSSIYKIRSKGHIVQEDYGVWTLQDGLISFLNSIPLSARRKNFQKYPVKLGTVIFKDKNIINSNFDDIPPTPDSFFQQDMPILYSLLQSVNATMQITVYDNHGYGKLNKSTGKITGDGMLRDLFDKKIDLASTMFLNAERAECYLPLAPIDFLGVKFFLKKPSLSYVKNIYVLSLSNLVWITTLLITILFIAGLYVSLKWEITTQRKINTSMVTAQNISVTDILLLCFEALCQQGTLIESFRISGRLLLLLLFLLFMFIYVAYSANILVLLKSSAHMNTLTELLESRYEVGGLNQSYVKHFFQGPKTGILRKLYLMKIHPNSYFDETRGLEKVQQGNFAFFAPVVISYKYFLRNFTNYDICALQELVGYMNLKSYPAVPKSSGYKEIFKIWLLNLQERGIAARSKVRVVRKPQCNNQAGNFQSVRIFDCLYVIMLYIYGTMLSVFVMVIEITVKKYSLLKNRHQIIEIHNY